MPKYTKQEQAEALERIREWVKPGDTVSCILRHVSSSGMTRVIQLVAFVDGEPRYLGYNAAIVLGMTYDRKREGVKVQGCGMDMGFHLVYNLGRVLFPEGFGVKCNARDGECDYRARTKDELTKSPTLKGGAHYVKGVAHTFYGRNGDDSGWDNDGGYALISRWL